jgi:voltage-gated potassium channel
LPHSRLLLPSDRRPITRWLRFWRAVYRDSLALWREFRRPIVVFALAIIGGGLLYGYLHSAAGKVSIPLTNLPLIMLMLMVLQAPLEMPHEPYLILFWYAMPFIGAYVVGRGVFDFARLFFDRSERRNAWEEAVASTYRNHVIVLGVGHLGLRVTKQLVSMGFETVAIDNSIDPDADTVLNTLGVPLIAADGRLPATLEMAGIRHADALIICTDEDFVNLELTMRARDMNPNIRIVVRMWDDQFAQQIKHFMNVEAVMSASDLAAPAFAGHAVGVEITQTLRIGEKDFSLIRLEVAKGSFMDGATIEHVQQNYGIDIVMYGHGDKVQLHPPDGSVIGAGDTLVVFAPHHEITKVVARNRRR